MLKEKGGSMTDSNITSAAVIGSGVMGHGFAQIFAQYGISVQLIDRTEEILAKAYTLIQDNLGRMIELSEITESEKEDILSRIQCTAEMGPNLAEAEFIIEAVSEDFVLKRDVWAALSKHAAPDAILASNTSSFDINELIEGIQNPERALGTHWFFPPQITPCVEVIPAGVTADDTVERTCALLTRLNKAPTLCKSAPGFVANRIQMAMVKESMALVEEGLATPEEVDRIVKTSIGFRLGAYGPFEVVDQAGIDTYLKVFEYLYDKLGCEHFTPPSLLREKVERGCLGLKNGKGFYEYGPDAADALRRNRTRKFYRRLSMFKQETAEDFGSSDPESSS
jgi:3-hydroxyacyl-CoA dehydrogenase